MDLSPSRITRGTILRPLLKAKGKDGCTAKNLWRAFCPNNNIDYDPSKCRNLDGLRVSVSRKWKKWRSYITFVETHESWLNEEFAIKTMIHFTFHTNTDILYYISVVPG